MNITLFNTLNSKEEAIIPMKENKISMYVCGPTVYDIPHIGNARSNLFYDLLFRIFRSMYGEVVYVRNITDVDDKIIARAKTENTTCEELTTKVIKAFHEDLSKLNCLPPTHEPKATQYITQMVELIQNLVQNGFAYEANGEWLFSVAKYQEYGQLSNKKLEDLIAGSRVEIKGHKNSPEDFVLWKNVSKEEYGFQTPLGYGRPGWHIECSAMALTLLGENFDIHGGGIDLQFPHHENEIAQSKCANVGSNYAKYWVHNGFLKVNGEKMSKSLGNFITITDAIASTNPLALRLCLLATHYRKPLDFNEHSLKTAEANLIKFNKALEQNAGLFEKRTDIKINQIPANAQDAIMSNINISKYLAIMHALPKDIKNTNDLPNKQKLAQEFWNMGALIGIFV
ncbi:MAG: cysteine--tRNA ligase [Proteobacteria bacterium]|jgi:cysteinyl-tRNA synthetase|nr:cysteine--tRNA ligase [Pseudomonadota bacterium]